MLYIYAIFLFALVWLSKIIIRRTIFDFISKLAGKTSSDLDDKVLEAIKRPTEFLIAVTGAYFAADIVSFGDPVGFILDNSIMSLFYVAIFWMIYNALEPMTYIVVGYTKMFGKGLSDDIANFVLNIIKFLIFAIAFMTILQEWGYNIGGFLASLGLVGMALAFAARDTVSNLFGSVVIFSDKPFEIGDWIKTTDAEGIVETIGMRSTKIRTFANALVSVPNGSLAHSSILNWTKMGKRRVKFDIGLTYDTDEKSMKNIVKQIKSMLNKHKDIHKDTIHIYFSAFGDSSLNIFCYYFTKSTAWDEFMRVREDTMFKIMQIVKSNNSNFAFPSSSIYIEKGQVD
ncbi:MAG: mechanosensitive ion channel family protein [Epsilonproteobacteria bacterium]|nr:MAG: mechanosensitive ion channel family protein [Campylobacterota bacterium]